MELSKLKKLLLNDVTYSLNNTFLVFKYDDESSLFIVKEYIDKIVTITHGNKKYIESLDEITTLKSQLFNFTNDINILFINNLELKTMQDRKLTNCIIICKKTDYKGDEVVVVPKLLEWQIEDYVRVHLNHLKDTSIKWLCQTCNYNIYRIANEVNKIKLFDNQEEFLEALKKDENFNDLTQFSIFNFIDSIIKKNYGQCVEILKNIDYIDIEPMGCVTLLERQFRNIIDIQMNRRATPESLEMQPKQFNAIKFYNCNRFNDDALIKIYKKIVDIDYLLKSGQLESKYIIDYLLINILNN